MKRAATTKRERIITDSSEICNRYKIILLSSGRKEGAKKTNTKVKPKGRVDGQFFLPRAGFLVTYPS
jgi:hypothetical protein